jgi:hypothetical protein
VKQPTKLYRKSRKKSREKRKKTENELNVDDLSKQEGVRISSALPFDTLRHL